MSWGSRKTINMNYFPDEVLEHVFDFITSHKDRNSVSLVCKSWYKIERYSRQRVFIGNCYSISPERLIARFPGLKSLTLKGKPHFADFNLVPYNWGGFVDPWIKALAESRIGLEELKLKRMMVSDDSLELLSKSFVNFKSLVLVSCEGFSTDGLAAIAANCRFLRELDLQENDVDDHRSHWLSCFHESCTSLVSLNFACLRGEINFVALERLVARSPNLKSLKLNRSVPLDTLQKLLIQAPQLVDLGIGSYVHDPYSETYEKLKSAIQRCKSIRSLSGFLEVAPRCMSAIYPICANLTFLNLSYALGLHGNELTKLIQHCRKLQRLWILDCIGDKGLGVVASTCKELQELRVFPSDPYGAENAAVTEEGMYAEQLEMLSIAFAGDSDKGMLYVLNGCKKLRKLEIRDCPFGNAALLEDVGKYETMRSLWMSSCEVTLGGCKTLAEKMPSLSVEIIDESEQMMDFSFDDRQKVERMYLYRTLVGHRNDAPDCVWIL
ncbi:hypothetical protein DITRI_Ditri16bG0153400 [Diplodiscus trichospermus]